MSWRDAVLVGSMALVAAAIIAALTAGFFEEQKTERACVQQIKAPTEWTAGVNACKGGRR